MENNGNLNDEEKKDGTKKVSVSMTTIVLVAIVFIILVVMVVIGLIKGNSEQSNQDVSISGNEANSSSQINSSNDTTDEVIDYNLDETNNAVDDSNEGNNNDNRSDSNGDSINDSNRDSSNDGNGDSINDSNRDSSNDGNGDNNNTNTTENNGNEEQIDKLNISDENLVNILAETEDFQDGGKLQTETYIAIVYRALNEGYIVLDKSRSNESGKSIVEYSTDEVNKILYSIFGVKLSEFKSYGEVFVYNNGKYVLHFSDGGTGAFQVKNIETGVAAGTEYLTYDLYYKDELGEEYRGNYSIGINNQTHFVSSKKKM